MEQVFGQSLSLAKIRASKKLADEPNTVKTELRMQKYRDRARYFRANPMAFVEDLGGFRPPIFDKSAKELAAAYNSLTPLERATNGARLMREKAEDYFWAGRTDTEAIYRKVKQS